MIYRLQVADHSLVVSVTARSDVDRPTPQQAVIAIGRADISVSRLSVHNQIDRVDRSHGRLPQLIVRIVFDNFF